MNFRDFHSEIRTRCSLVGATKKSPVEKHPKHFDAVVAASAKVFSDHGAEWCLANQHEAVKAIWDNLSLWWKVGFAIASFFIPGGVIWLTVIQYLVPIIWDYFHEQHAAGLCSAGAFSSLGQSVDKFVQQYGESGHV